MALLELFIQNTTGASNLNAGTDQTEPASSIASVSCTVTGGTITFTGASGAFTAAGVAVNSWVSLYNSGDSASRFIGQVASTDGTTITVLYNSGNGYSTTGFGLATGITSGGGANTVFCRVGGAWKDLGITGTNGAMNGSTPSLSGALTGSTYNGLRVNVKAYTYTIAATVTLPLGLAAKPIWWRGYYSTLTGTPGSATGYASDIDNLGKAIGTVVNGPSGATRPIISCNAVNTGVSVSANTWVENIEFQSHTTASTITPVSFNNATTGTLRFYRCRFTVRYAGVSCFTQFANNTYAHFAGCLFQGDLSLSVTAGTGLSLTSTLGATVMGCTFRNCATGISGTNTSYACIYESCTTGISGSTTAVNNVFRACTTGISVSGTQYLVDVNNIFSECGTGLNVSLTNPWNANIINNDYWLNTSYAVTGLWESFERGPITNETGSPFVAAGSPNYDYTLTSGSKARQAGFPGQFEV